MFMFVLTHLQSGRQADASNMHKMHLQRYHHHPPPPPPVPKILLQYVHTHTRTHRQESSFLYQIM